MRQTCKRDLLVGAEVDAGDAQVVACADVAGRELQRRGVRVHRLLAPTAVRQCRAQLVP